MADKTTFWLDGQAYELDAFKLKELAYLERECGDIEDPQVLRSMDFAMHLITVIKRRDNPTFTVDDAGEMDLTVFDQPDDNVPPQKPARRKAGASTRSSSGATS